MLEGTETAASKIYHNHSWKVYKRILQLPGRREPRAFLAHELEKNCNAVILFWEPIIVEVFGRQKAAKIIGM